MSTIVIPDVVAFVLVCVAAIVVLFGTAPRSNIVTYWTPDTEPPRPNTPPDPF